MLRPPCETVVATFVRAVRVMIAKKLTDEENLSQMEIGRILGVSQPVINQYLADAAKKVPDSLRRQVQETSNEILKARNADATAEEILSTLCKACKQLRTDGEMCQLHKAQVPSLKPFASCTGCRVGDREALDELIFRRRLIVEIEGFRDYLINLPNFAALIPAVGTQIVLAHPSAQSQMDTIALPGGIVSAKGHPVSVSKFAEFGSSRTTAKILLAKRKLSPNIHATIALRNTAKMRGILSQKSLNIMEMAAGKWETEFAKRQSEATEADIIADTGGFGLEPILYCFAENARRLQEIIDFLVKNA